MDMFKKVLSDPVNKWIFENSGTEVYLVGGYVRDLILGKTSMDKDYVLKSNVRKTAVRFAAEFNGTFIDLKKKRTLRVVLNKRDYIDFNYLQNSINNDLKQRDFNLNAIAWSPETGIVDPLNGLKDINNKVVRAIDKKNLLNDPLRLLRAYRIASQLGFEIDEDTRKMITECSNEIRLTAPERITEDFFKLLSSQYSSQYIKICFKDKLLPCILSLSKPSFKLLIKQLEDFDHLIMGLNRYEYKGINRYKVLNKLKIDIGQGLKIESFIRLALVFLHTKDSSLNASSLIRLSNSIKNRLSGFLKAHMLITGRVSDTELFDIYSMAGDAVFDISLLLSLNKRKNMKRFINSADDFVKLEKKCILSGDEIQDLLNILPGPRVGEIKREISKIKFRGLIKNRSDAKKWIVANLT